MPLHIFVFNLNSSPILFFYHRDILISTKNKEKHLAILLRRLYSWRVKNHQPFIAYVSLMRLISSHAWAETGGLPEEHGSTRHGQRCRPGRMYRRGTGPCKQGRERQKGPVGEGYRRESQVHYRLNEAKSNFISFAAKPRVGVALGAHAALGAEDTCPGWPALTLVLKRHSLCFGLNTALS